MTLAQTQKISAHLFYLKIERRRIWHPLWIVDTAVRRFHEILQPVCGYILALHYRRKALCRGPQNRLFALVRSGEMAIRTDYNCQFGTFLNITGIPAFLARCPANRRDQSNDDKEDVGQAFANTIAQTIWKLRVRRCEDGSTDQRFENRQLVRVLRERRRAGKRSAASLSCRFLTHRHIA